MMIMIIMMIMMMMMWTTIVSSTKLINNPQQQQQQPVYNVLVLMVEKSQTNRFDLVHIGPAIDIAQKVCSLKSINENEK